ncbi:unnamed protein product [Darwinula stevensoni]|uniref:Uncharacterized protein n=1 Tax=Darwinula stevensoni TaxID=69355 RepID=A0A7R8XC86_9CRUS|nr:unnamed protein product [Darwinula stevensoni]CAG0893537.1 unnamed protein product [Darwinula stevensoni]
MYHFWQPKERNYFEEGEKALQSFCSILERKEWTIEKNFNEEGIIVKSFYDEEKKKTFLLTEHTSEGGPPPTGFVEYP